MENVIISDCHAIHHGDEFSLFSRGACAIVENHTTVKHHQFNLMDANCLERRLFLGDVVEIMIRAVLT